ncbi:MAG TPA: VCBS repeat-containing protein [Puia sp.]|uniref:VCBS repeat-containing protein n=1 Tax=Puia sp. TaxID=2045100 RepID=UPI002BE5E2AD|nr:VCBS repeat-containing protein [Puia sp.]HVU97052.1 VCBS repeat-containing protein [Puia sp.]
MKRLIFLLLLPAIRAGAQSPLFRLLPAKETGIHFSNDIAETEELNVLSYEYFYNGGGVAVGDINNDGLPDLFFTANSKPCKLFLNLGGLKFKDVTREAGLEGRPNSWKTGVTMADVNGDGLPDIYICYSGKNAAQRGNQLFINHGNLHFTEEAAAYGLNDSGYCTQAAFFDYDNDGDLDMFLLRHSVKKIDNMELASHRDELDPLAGDKLFENAGGHFVDVSKKAGLRQSPLTYGLGIAIADINKDGWPDVYVTNDYNEPDYLYLNNHNGTFTDASAGSFRHLAQFSMGVDIADINNDGLPDVLNLDMLPEDNRRQKLLQLQENYESFQLMTGQGLQQQYMRNMLQLNNGDGTFSEIGQLAGIFATDWSWCPLLADFDNDGNKDVFITNGYLRDYTNKDFLRYWGDYKIRKAMDREPVKLMDLVQAMPSSTLKKYIFRNNGDLTFTNMQAQWGINQPAVSSGAIYADLDNDGDLDLVVNNINSEAFVYRNMSSERGGASWLGVQLKGKGGNTAAIGAKVYAYAGGKVQYAEVNPARGYLSCVPAEAHFGFGTLKTADSLIVVWPDQQRQKMEGVALNRKLVLKEERVEAQAPPTALKTVFSAAPALIDYKPEGFGDNDFKRQLLMLFMYSRTGPVIAEGDVNKDGREDLFISGDKTRPGMMYMQGPGGKFEGTGAIVHEDSATVAAATFFDANGDGWPDLYVAKGGYSLWEPHTSTLQDELWLNDGKGVLHRAEGMVPDLSANSKSCVRPCDYDGDGDIDLFVGGRVIPGQYPLAPESYLLTNDGKGHFTITTTPFQHIGMVTDAQWIDLDGDGRKDLILCGEFMPVMVFLNTPTGFVDKTSDWFGASQPGFWNTLTVADLDGDGKPDVIAGNMGQNCCVKFSGKEPGELYFADFDHNGSIDPFFNFYIQGVSYPFVSRDELNEQIYPMRKKFNSYKDYSNATMKDLFSKEELAAAGKLTVTQDRTMCWLNKGGHFVPADLPVQAQFAPVTRVLAGDFDGDGHTDLVLLGNHSDNRLKIGSIDANYGCLLKGDGAGGFRYVPQPVSGLSVKGDVKSAVNLGVDGKKYLVIGVAEGALQFYREP